MDAAVPSPALASRPIGAVARRIARQIEARLDGHRPSGDAFVVSVYGEWGVGKTYCLKGVREHFQRGLDAAVQALKPAAETSEPSPAASDLPAPATAASQPSFVVPVWFDPWQYEHEEHLVVPLLKTIEHALRTVEEKVGAREHALRSLASKAAGAGVSVAHGLRRAGNVVGDVAVALASGFKFKLAPLKELTGLEVDFAPKDILDASRAAAERRKTDATAQEEAEAQRSASGRLTKQLKDRESLYFDTRQALSDLADAEEMSLRFVVLVDDLDRCLPEKAIQMLESVKLFVNARGFSFVLAVDDEVVERGIAHRYRDYAPAGGTLPSAPISGAEYLEKIVHLPVHLQRWTADEACVFLREDPDYGSLFGSRTECASADASQPARDAPDAAGYLDSKPHDAARFGRAAASVHADAEGLLDFMVGSLPLVPRKLIRLAEALLFLRDHFAAEGQLAHWNALHAARLAALQQLYPPLYRHLRRQPERYWRLFLIKRDAFDDPVYHGPGGGSLTRLEQRYKERHEAETEAASDAARVERASIAEMLGLLRLVHECSQLRGAPDPLHLFGDPRQPVADHRPEPSSIVGEFDSYRQFAQLYVHGLALAERPAAASPSTGVVDASHLQSQVADAEGFVARLLDADPISRRAFIEAECLDGPRLPDAVFDHLLAQLQLPAYTSRVLDLEWLRDAARVVGPEQLLRLYQDCRVVDRLLRGEPTTRRPLP